MRDGCPGVKNYRSEACAGPCTWVCTSSAQALAQVLRPLEPLAQARQRGLHKPAGRALDPAGSPPPPLAGQGPVSAAHDRADACAAACSLCALDVQLHIGHWTFDWTLHTAHWASDWTLDVRLHTAHCMSDRTLDIARPIGHWTFDRTLHVRLDTARPIAHWTLHTAHCTSDWTLHAGRPIGHWTDSRSHTDRPVGQRVCESCSTQRPGRRGSRTGCLRPPP